MQRTSVPSQLTPLAAWCRSRPSATRLWVPRGNRGENSKGHQLRVANTTSSRPPHAPFKALRPSPSIGVRHARKCVASAGARSAAGKHASSAPEGALPRARRSASRGTSPALTCTPNRRTSGLWNGDKTPWWKPGRPNHLEQTNVGLPGQRPHLAEQQSRPSRSRPAGRHRRAWGQEMPRNKVVGNPGRSAILAAPLELTFQSGQNSFLLTARGPPAVPSRAAGPPTLAARARTGRSRCPAAP